MILFTSFVAIFIKFCRLTFRTNPSRIFFKCSFLAYHNCATPWSLNQIQAVGITDYNVVELIARNIQKLPEETQDVLKLAACIGDKFNLEVLAIVNEKSQSETAAHLWEALQAGLVLPLSEAYKIPLVFTSDEMSREGKERISPDSPLLSSSPDPLP